MDKICFDARLALEDPLIEGMFVAAGGFGLCGTPELLISAIREAGTKNMTIASNNFQRGRFWPGLLLKTKQIKKVICSYVVENAEFARQ